MWVGGGTGGVWEGGGGGGTLENVQLPGLNQLEEDEGEAPLALPPGAFTPVVLFPPTTAGVVWMVRGW